MSIRYWRNCKLFIALIDMKILNDTTHVREYLSFILYVYWHVVCVHLKLSMILPRIHCQLKKPIFFTCKHDKDQTTDQCLLTHWGQLTHICAGELTVIDSDNGLSPGRRQAIIWTNAAILFIESLKSNYSKIQSKIHTFSLKKGIWKMSSAKWQAFCLGLNVLSENFNGVINPKRFAFSPITL